MDDPEERVEITRFFRAAAKKRGLVCEALQPLELGGKRWILTDGSDVLVRVSRSDAILLVSPSLELTWAKAFERVVSTQSPLLDEPVVFGEWTATFWRYVDGASVGVGHAFVHGAQLRLIHERVQSPVGCGSEPMDQLATAWSRLVGVDGTVNRELTGLLNHSQRVIDTYEGGAKMVPSHGDAHDRNLLVDQNGNLVWLDFDSAGFAPATLDLASGVYAYHYNHADDVAVQRFLDGYDASPLQREASVALAWVRRVRATCTRAAKGEDVSSRLADLAKTRPLLA